MKKKVTLWSLLTLVLLITGCAAGSTRIRFGAAGLGGTYHVFADTFAQVLTGQNEKYDVDVKDTAGSAANLRLLSDGYIQMAIAQTDLTNDAYYGTGIFHDGNIYQGYSAIAGLYTEACQIVVRKDSGIESVEDLQGKTVSVGEEESGTEQNAEQILAAYGLSEKLVDEVNLDYTSAADELKEGTIDALFCTAGTATTMIGELARQCEIKLIALDENAIGKLLGSYDFYTRYTIPAGTYQNQTEDVQTVGVKAVLLASNQLSEKTVEKITQILFEQKQQLQYALPVDLELDEQEAVEGITIPFHEGAETYYNSLGISVTTE